MQILTVNTQGVVITFYVTSDENIVPVDLIEKQP
jgi:hypothetical protein